jgi:hypothetical protein
MVRSVIKGLFFLLSLVAVPASAEPTFPGAIQEAAKIPCTPTCLLCHLTVPGEPSNWTQPFGLTVRANGLVPGHPESIQTVVDNLRAKMVDTDHDGKLDVDELAAGTDPNKADPKAEVCGPVYGCGAHVATAPLPARPTALWWFTLPAGLGLLIAMRRQSLRRQRRTFGARP